MTTHGSTSAYAIVALLISLSIDSISSLSSPGSSDTGSPGGTEGGVDVLAERMAASFAELRSEDGGFLDRKFSRVAARAIFDVRFSGESVMPEPEFA